VASGSSVLETIFSANTLFRVLLGPTISHHSFCGVITVYNFAPIKRDDFSVWTVALKSRPQSFATRTSHAEHTVNHCHVLYYIVHFCGAI